MVSETEEINLEGLRRATKKSHWARELVKVRLLWEKEVREARAEMNAANRRAEIAASRLEEAEHLVSSLQQDRQKASLESGGALYWLQQAERLLEAHLSNEHDSIESLECGVARALERIMRIREHLANIPKDTTLSYGVDEAPADWSRDGRSKYR